jgi:hypothetical protein
MVNSESRIKQRALTGNMLLEYLFWSTQSNVFFTARNVEGENARGWQNFWLVVWITNTWLIFSCNILCVELIIFKGNLTEKEILFPWYSFVRFFCYLMLTLLTSAKFDGKLDFDTTKALKSKYSENDCSFPYALCDGLTGF